MIVQKYFGCDCYCLDHVSHILYDIPKKNEDIEDDEDVIYFTVKTRNLFNRIFPPLIFNPRYFTDYWSDYFRYHILKRIPIALKYIFNPRYIKKGGITDCFDFKNDDLDSIKKLISNLVEEGSYENHQSVIYLNNDKLQLRFTIEQISSCIPYQLGWDLQFITNRNLFNRIKFAFKYIFNSDGDEQDFEIDKKTAKKLIGMITATQRINNKNEK